MIDHKKHILDKNPQKVRFALNATDLYLKSLNLLSNMVPILDVTQV